MGGGIFTQLLVYLITSNIYVVDLSQIIFKHSSFTSNPLFSLEPGLLLDNPHHVRHLLDGNHLLLVDSHPQVGDAINGRLDVGLLEGFNVDVSLDMLRSNYGSKQTEELVLELFGN